MARDDATLLDIARAARLVLEFVRDYSEPEFFQDSKTQSAVLHQLLVIGEATKRLSSEFRAQHGDMPWSLIAGMRDKLIHAYDAVDLGEVWQTATRDIPSLLAELKAILPPEQL